MKRAHLIQPLVAAALAAAPIITLLVATPASAQERYQPLSIEQLLEPCIEGDNDSRDGLVLEMQCEQYIHGYLDAHLSLNAEQSLCFEEAGDPVDLVRRAFMKWAYKNYSRRGEPASEGLKTVLSEAFYC